jgi:hypothetical protein
VHKFEDVARLIAELEAGITAVHAEASAADAEPTAPGATPSPILTLSPKPRLAPVPSTDIDTDALWMFLEDAKERVRAVTQRLDAAQEAFVQVAQFYAQKVGGAAEVRAQEPQRFMGHLWDLVSRVQAASKERAKVEGVCCLFAEAAGHSAPF